MEQTPAEDLRDLESLIAKKPVALISAGPSLDFCAAEIRQLNEQKAVFVVADILAPSAEFLCPGRDRIFFTVEPRRHQYLSALRGENIAAWTGSHPHNPPRGNRLHHFDLKLRDQQSAPGRFSSLPSPGTVSGAALSWLLSAAAAGRGPVSIHIFGMDLAYPDRRMYSRYVHSLLLPVRNRLVSREELEWEMVLKRTSHLWQKQGQAIRTSEELLKTRENIALLLDSFHIPLPIADYSPLGISHEKVEKKIPLLVYEAMA